MGREVLIIASFDKGEAAYYTELEGWGAYFWAMRAVVLVFCMHRLIISPGSAIYSQ